MIRKQIGCGLSEEMLHAILCGWGLGGGTGWGLGRGMAAGVDRGRGRSGGEDGQGSGGVGMGLGRDGGWDMLWKPGRVARATYSMRGWPFGLCCRPRMCSHCAWGS